MLTGFKVRDSYSLSFLLIAGFVFPAHAENMSGPQIDELVGRALTTSKVPGIAVVVVKDGNVALAKGYGLRSANAKDHVDENTLFNIASNSKAFTAAALGILVDEGKLHWDDTVVAHIPEFELYDPYVTSQFTVRDLLTHRSGLGMAGNLMQNLTPNGFTRADIIHGLRFLKPSASFRSRFDYDNLFYIVAAELVSRTSGMSWQDFVESRIMIPLGMTHSGASYVRVKTRPNIADGHYRLDGKLTVDVRDDSESDAGAGGIYASASDLGKWMLMHLSEGKYGASPDRQLISQQAHKEMWTPQTIVPTGRNGVYNTHFCAYGLGWFLSDVGGYRQVSHTGEDSGTLSEVALIPELKLGIAVLANQEDAGDVPRAIVDQITDSYLGISGTRRIKENAGREVTGSATIDPAAAAIWQEVARLQSSGDGKLDGAGFTGTYRDNWFGDCTISLAEGKLWFQSAKSPQLTGQLFPYQESTFVVKWKNPRLRPADALAHFTRNEKGTVQGIRMKTIVPAAASSFDFQDLDLIKIEP